MCLNAWCLSQQKVEREIQSHLNISFPLRRDKIPCTFLNRKLLASKSDGIEVSYNAAGIICHLASDCPLTTDWRLWDEDTDSAVTSSQDSSAPENFPMMDSMNSDAKLSTHELADDTGRCRLIQAMDSGAGSRIARQEVMTSLVNAINCWQLESQRSINYRYVFTQSVSP